MLLSPRLLLPSVRLFAMPSQPAQESRKWHFSQEKCFLDILCLPEFKPIGGDGDGVMERKDVARWTPLLERFSNENAQLVATASTSTNVQLKTTFDVKMLQRKWQTFKETYQRMKREHKVSRHLLAGETGAAGERQATTAQQAVDAANVAWPHFTQFHTAFGPVQRLRDDTYVEMCSPFKTSTPSGGDRLLAIPSPAKYPSNRAPRAAAKKARTAVDAALHDAASDDGDPDFDAEPELHNSSPEEHSADADGKSSGSAVHPRKRSRVSTRDVQLASQVANDRMAVAVKAHELKEATSLKVTNLNIANKNKIMDRQEKLAERQLAVQEAANAVQTEKTRAMSILELTTLYTSVGKDPAEAFRLAQAAVAGTGGSTLCMYPFVHTMVYVLKSA
jgi:hypothetical protein